MNVQSNHDHHAKPGCAPQQKVAGALIDAQGREVPITEQMIQQACKALEESWVERVRKD